MAEENILDIFQGASKSLCNSVLDQVHDAVVWLDKDRKVVYWNKAAELISGRESASVLGRACFEEPALFVDFGGVNVCHDKCPVAMTLKDGAPRSLEVYLQHKQGFRTPASLRIIAHIQGGRRDHRGRRDLLRHGAQDHPAARPARAREDGPRRARDGHPLEAVPGHDPGDPPRGIPEVRAVLRAHLRRHRQLRQDPRETRPFQRQQDRPDGRPDPRTRTSASSTSSAAGARKNS